DTSHNAWHGSYSSFGEWRRRIAEVAGFPPLPDMWGHSPVYKGEPPGKQLPWGTTSGDPRLIPLLNHSDCDGEIAPVNCHLIAEALEELLPKLRQRESDRWIWGSTVQFINGCRDAAATGEPLEFY